MNRTEHLRLIRNLDAAKAAYRTAADSGDPVVVGATWEDYLDACVALNCCVVFDCDRAATPEGDGRCPRHAWGDPVAEAPAPRPLGYTECACRDCFDVTIGGGNCSLCEEANCDAGGDEDCDRPDAYEG